MSERGEFITEAAGLWLLKELGLSPCLDGHVVTRYNEHYYVCECGGAGSETWANQHQF